MDKLKTIATGGFPMILDDFRWFLGRLTAPNEGIYAAFNNMLRGFGDNFIVQGCVLGGVSGAFTLTEGWIMLGGELIKVDAQPAFDETPGGANDNTFVRSTTFNTRGNKTFRNATTADTYEINRASISGAGGTLAYNGKTLFQLSNQAVFSSGIVTLTKKVIEIGVWDMDATTSINVAHGLSDVTKLRRADVIIQDDAGGNVYKLDTGSPSAGSVEGFGATNVNLLRVGAAFFDDPNFNNISGSYNRGWLTIEYEN